MPKITQLPTVPDISAETTFVLINSGSARRYTYQNLETKLAASIGGTSDGLSSRETVSSTTSNIDADVTTTVIATGYKTYVLSKISTTYPAWVRIYSSANSMDSDAGRLEGVDPLPGSGVIAEVITSNGSLTQLITPGVIGFNSDNTVGVEIYMRVTNKDNVSRSIAVSLTILKLES